MPKTPFHAAGLLLALLLAASAPQARAEPVADAPAFRAAMAAYEACQWPQSYAAFVRLADGGNVEAARIAAQMHRWGPRLYGMRFAATDSQLAQWQQLTRCAAPGAASCEQWAGLH